MDISKAVDLKAKADNAHLVLSDFLHTLKGDISGVYSQLSEKANIREEVEKAKKELSELKKQVAEGRAIREQEREDMARQKEKHESDLASIRSIAKSEKEESEKILAEAKDQAASILRSQEDFNRKVSEFEAKKAKIAELAR
jgi:cell division septum initiation protein DivIVA